jgi:hypothetical protein
MLQLLEDILKSVRASGDYEAPSTTSTIVSSNANPDLDALWKRLTPDERAVLLFAWRHESTGLTYSAIAEHSVFWMTGRLPSGVNKSDKTIRKCARALFANGLLTRDGPRSGIHLTPLGHDLVAYGKTHDKQRLSD